MEKKQLEIMDLTERLARSMGCGHPAPGSNPGSPTNQPRDVY